MTPKDIHNNIKPVEKQADSYKNVATLERVGSNVIIGEHAVANGYVIISQTIDDDTDHIMINTNEIDDLIDVLQNVKAMIFLSKIGA